MPDSKPARIPLLVDDDDFEALQMAGVLILDVERHTYVLTEKYRRELHEARTRLLAEAALARSDLYNATLDQCGARTDLPRSE